MQTTAPRTHEGAVHTLDVHHVPMPPRTAQRVARTPVTGSYPGKPSAERVAVTGSRQRTDRHTIEAAIAALPEGVTVVTGGCEGPDLWAEAAARARSLTVETLFPDLPARGPGYLFTRAYHERNSALVDACDRLIAFPVAPHGGTWHTVKAALTAGKHIEIIPPPCPTATLGQEP